MCHYGDNAGRIGRGRTLPHIKSYCAYSPAEVPQVASATLSHPSSAYVSSAGNIGGIGGGPIVHWSLLTSSNMSTKAWGLLQNCDTSRPDFCVASYELGVLLFNEPGAKELRPSFSAAISENDRVLPLPYSLPPRPYGVYDDPWASDKRFPHPVRTLFFPSRYFFTDCLPNASNLTRVDASNGQDSLGQQWPCSVELYGAMSTSRHGLAMKPPGDAEPYAALA